MTTTEDLGASATLKNALERLITQRRTPSAAAPSSEKGEESHANLGEIISALDERAFGLMILLLALPCCLPFIYLIPQIVALPMLALAGQLALGRPSPWLPSKLNDREVPLQGMLSVVERGERYIGWFERISKPRLRFLSNRTGARVTGALLAVPAASILVPLPSTNTIPGIGVAITSIGLVERDGILILLGLLVGFAWVALLLFFGEATISIAKNALFN